MSLSAHSLELATAALMSEIIRADNKTQDDELAAYRHVLSRQFSLTDDELDALMSDGQDTAEEAVDLVQFTKVVNDQCHQDEKRTILKGLWQVAYADEEIAPIEEHTIRRIADLLYLPHSVFIKTKLEVTGE
ncbi:tellurite resistance TerB family protein [Alteromonas sp. CYL-A6]|uniref:tellurite resistance TerB family protein n=1 Tax=Alteromonas nitratireducens TaxID=3390813 RepID=UPI0034B9387A